MWEAFTPSGARVTHVLTWFPGDLLCSDPAESVWEAQEWTEWIHCEIASMRLESDELSQSSSATELRAQAERVLELPVREIYEGVWEVGLYDEDGNARMSVYPAYRIVAGEPPRRDRATSGGTPMWTRLTPAGSRATHVLAWSPYDDPFYPADPLDINLLDSDPPGSFWTLYSWEDWKFGDFDRGQLTSQAPSDSPAAALRAGVERRLGLPVQEIHESVWETPLVYDGDQPLPQHTYPAYKIVAGEE